MSTRTRLTAKQDRASSRPTLVDRIGAIRGWPLLQLTPAGLVVLLGLVVPVGVFALYSFWTIENFNVVTRWNLDNYREVVESEAYRRLLANTLLTAAATAALTTALAYGFAHAIRFKLRHRKDLLVLLTMVALFSGYLVRIFAWRTLLGNEGVINSTLLAVGLIDEPMSALLYNRYATVLVLVNFMLPMAILPIYASLENVKDVEIEAARDLGCGPGRAVWSVVLPLAWRGVFTSFALTYIVAAGDYLTPELVGGTSGTMIGQSIADSFLGAFDWPRGAALSFVTLACILASLAAFRWLSGRIIR